ncbi:MAG: hypothetical protein ACR2KV_09615 [Solirubrobacteraceae bacterium]
MEVTMPELPIACSLSASDLTRRLANIAELGRDALVDARTDATRAELRFAVAAGVRERVTAVVAAESECCAFLRMRVIDEADTVVLIVEAPAGAEPVLAEFVSAFRGAPRAV